MLLQQLSWPLRAILSLALLLAGEWDRMPRATEPLRAATQPAQSELPSRLSNHGKQGGSPSYVQRSAVASGLSVNTSTGLISGTPTAAWNVHRYPERNN